MSDDAGRQHLKPPGASSSFREYVSALWSLRDYAWLTGQSQVRAGNAGTSFGAVWLFLEPVFSIAIYWVVFGVLLDVSRGVDNFLAFLTVGQVTFGLSQRALLGASSSLTAHAPMLRSLAFPRAVLPVSAVLKAVAAYRAELVVMFIAVLIMGESVRWSWPLILPVALLQAATSLGAGMGLARVVFRFPDAQRFVTHLLRLGFYASGVFFPLHEFTDNTAVLIGATLNPFYDFVELARWCVLGQRPTQAVAVVIASLLWAAISLVAGGWYFHRAEHVYSGARTVQKHG